MAAHPLLVVPAHGLITDTELAAALDRPPETTAASIAVTAF